MCTVFGANGESACPNFCLQFGCAVDADVSAGDEWRVVFVRQHPIDLLGEPRRNRGGKDSARLEDTGKLADRANIVLDVLEHLGSDDGVERVIGEGQLRRITTHDAAQVLLFDFAGFEHRRKRFPRGDDLVCCVVEGDDLGASSRRLEGVPTEASTRVKHRPVDVAAHAAFVAEMRGFGRREAGVRADRMLDEFALRDEAQEYAVNYSLGMKKKLGLACALIHEPEVLILDEPINGLDPRASRDVQERLRDLAARGCTVLVSTHLLDMAERLCSRIGIFHKGQLAALGTPAEVKQRMTSAGQGASLEDVFLQITGAGAADADAQELRP